MTSPLRHCDVICQGLVINSLGDWDARLRDAVTRLAVLTEQKLREEISAQKQEKAFQVPPSYVELVQRRGSSGKMVPRDRIELSTPAFSGHQQNKKTQ